MSKLGIACYDLAQVSNGMVSVGFLHPTYTSCCSLVLCYKSQGLQFNSWVWICAVCTAGMQYPLLITMSEGPA